MNPRPSLEIKTGNPKVKKKKKRMKPTGSMVNAMARAHPVCK
jgi:hypothetical protein